MFINIVMLSELVKKGEVLEFKSARAFLKELNGREDVKGAGVKFKNFKSAKECGGEYFLKLNNKFYMLLTDNALNIYKKLDLELIDFFALKEVEDHIAAVSKATGRPPEAVKWYGDVYMFDGFMGDGETAVYKAASGRRITADTVDNRDFFERFDDAYEEWEKGCEYRFDLFVSRLKYPFTWLTHGKHKKAVRRVLLGLTIAGMVLTIVSGWFILVTIFMIMVLIGLAKAS